MKRTTLFLAVLIFSMCVPFTIYAGIKDRLQTIEEELEISADKSADIKTRIAACEKEIGIETEDSIAAIDRIAALEVELGISATSEDDILKVVWEYPKVCVNL